MEDCAETLCFSQGKKTTRLQDHIVYGIRDGDRFDVFPGALTRISATENGRTESQHGGGGKDTWVLQDVSTFIPVTEPFRRPKILPARPVTSRVAEGFYWLGRYLERAMNISKMIQVIETIEMEELTSAERRLYRPVWNRLLPPLEHAGKKGRRSMASPIERYRLMLDSSEMGSVISIVKKGMRNADSLREAISPEAWSALLRFAAFSCAAVFVWRLQIKRPAGRRGAFQIRRWPSFRNSLQLRNSRCLQMMAGDSVNWVNSWKEPSRRQTRREAWLSQSLKRLELVPLDRDRVVCISTSSGFAGRI